MISQESISEVEHIYGPLTGVFIEQAYAKLYALNQNPVYVPGEQCFYRYESQSGLWLKQRSEEMIESLSLFLHEYAIAFCARQIETKRKLPVLRSMLTFLQAQCAQPDFFKPVKNVYIHCLNGILELDESGEWILKPFSPDYHSRNRREIVYDPAAQCPRFLNELLYPLVTDDDVNLLQQYIGQCLTGKNITQSILLLTGSGGSGKGTLANILEMIVGEGNYTQIRPGQIRGRFETSFFIDKILLTGKESNGSFFSENGMNILKALVGDDKLRAELKNSNQHNMITGTYNVFVVGNTPPVMAFESDADMSAWRRRLRWVRCKKYKPTHPIPDFAGLLMAEESSGILNFALTGAKKILQSGISNLPCSENQTRNLNFLFQMATPLETFLRLNIEKSNQYDITVDELVTAFMEFTRELELPQWTERKVQVALKNAMLSIFGVVRRRDIKRPDSNGKLTNRSGFAYINFKQ